jgi:OHCU decarboxylase
MLTQRPFKDAAEVFSAAERFWRELAPNDWLEAFRAHPRIGEKDAQDAKDAKDAKRTRGWSAQEQAGMNAASADVRAELARANAEYEKKFGFIYIVSASGKSPKEMLALCRARLANAPGAELTIAAEEQLKITRLRLEKLLTL